MRKEDDDVCDAAASGELDGTEIEIRKVYTSVGGRKEGEKEEKNVRRVRGRSESRVHAMLWVRVGKRKRAIRNERT